jgi:hypothetical protein
MVKKGVKFSRPLDELSPAQMKECGWALITELQLRENEQ